MRRILGSVSFALMVTEAVLTAFAWNYCSLAVGVYGLFATGVCAGLWLAEFVL